MSNHNEFIQNGYVVFEKYFSNEDITQINNAIEEVKSLPDIDVYKDRSGNLRRIEHFTYRHDVLKRVDEKLKALLLDVTSTEQALFKDKINFKPPGGEGFYAHYDGIFQFQKKDGVTRNGWYEYASDFNNALIVLDSFTDVNGALEISRIRRGDFETLLADTKCNGTPDIKDDLTVDLEFRPLYCPRGSVVLFKHNCPHRSGPNYSASDRRSLYLTYNNLSDGAFYDAYFLDKTGSTNQNKALTGDLA